MTVPAETIAWPGAAKCAASFSFDVDAESAMLAVDHGHATRMSAVSHQAYGPLVGVPRILKILARHGITSTFFVPGYTALRYPDVIRSIAAEGHEIAHHGYLHEAMAGLSAEEEAVILDRGLEALERVTGSRPTGYRAPMWELNWHSPKLLHDRGFLYDSSLMDADHPYELTVGSESLVEIPIQWALDDWEQYCFVPDFSGTGLIESPTKVAEMWRLEFDGMRAVGGCFVLTNHPFLSGRPSRAAALEGLVEYACSLDDVWVSPLGAIAQHVRGLGLTPRSVERPDPADF
ncbi:polysaccharide deacetylase [Mycolicibacterium madagascariense]|uniref:Polysaccharide deacetylase n=1 Tax=Mycolicibacterium madagascariense TaxID=212765 RepID=A0A7I7XCJ4_9MYCO|nr:polysaccharide deacetylase [Mycolicibacterium madagascariense]MCV7013605.1 polysaccharide deacetylase [Mycolicibacterium madagascariense]BBZ27055.1 polysaccharide deacetylase [Mycolicibacterium madagascariense]